MSDKSPRQGMSKKSSKSIKEKRADKRAKAHPESLSEQDAPEQEAVSLLSLGVLGRSAKENEHRLPLHPDHLARLPPPRWPPGSPSSRGTARRSVAATTSWPPSSWGGIATREEIFERSDVVLLLKLQHETPRAARGPDPAGAGRTACRTPS